MMGDITPSHLVVSPKASFLRIRIVFLPCTPLPTLFIKPMALSALYKRILSSPRISALRSPLCASPTVSLLAHQRSQISSEAAPRQSRLRLSVTFNLRRQCSGNGNKSHTTSGSHVSTYAYMCPRQYHLVQSVVIASRSTGHLMDPRSAVFVGPS